MRLFKLFIYLSLCLILIPTSSCIFDSDEEDDPCNRTIAPQISVNYHLSVSTYYQVEGEARQPLNHARMNIQVDKELCDGEIKGIFTFNQSDTGEDNVYNLTPVGYNLHNFGDAVNLTANLYYFDQPEDETVTVSGGGYGKEIFNYIESEPYDDMTMVFNMDIVLSATRSTQ